MRNFIVLIIVLVHINCFAQDNLYLFSSFSVPKLSQIALVKDAKAYGIPIYLRGFKNNSFKETVRAFSELNTDGGLLIEPTLFKTYDIKAVPALVYQGSDNTYILTGNLSLSAMLDELCDKKVKLACAMLDEKELRHE